MIHERIAINGRDDVDGIGGQERQEGGPHQYLVKDVPKVVNRAARVVEVRSGRARIGISKLSPHRIVEELAGCSLTLPRTPGRNATVHYRM